MWTEPGRQPPLFYFLRPDTLDYLNRVRALLQHETARFALHLS